MKRVDKLSDGSGSPIKKWAIRKLRDPGNTWFGGGFQFVYTNFPKFYPNPTHEHTFMDSISWGLRRL